MAKQSMEEPMVPMKNSASDCSGGRAMHVNNIILRRATCAKTIMHTLRYKIIIYMYVMCNIIIARPDSSMQSQNYSLNNVHCTYM